MEPRAIELPGEEAAADANEAAYLDLLTRLARQSVSKHFDAYADVRWDDADHVIEPEDPRFELPASEPLGASDWYRSQPDAKRARLGLHMTASFLRMGIDFENVLKRGLLEFTIDRAPESPEFRYAYHEIIEEAHHSLMFREFIARTGIRVETVPERGSLRERRLGRSFASSMSRQVALLGRRFPELFFVFALGGEDPIDYQQRRALERGDRWTHPLLRRITKIHITEEARHLSFARAFLRKHVPRLSRRRRVALATLAPIAISEQAKAMLQPTLQVRRTYEIPDTVYHACYRDSAAHHADVAESLAKLRTLLGELGLTREPYRRLWKRSGIWQGGAAA